MLLILILPSRAGFREFFFHSGLLVVRILIFGLYTVFNFNFNEWH